MPFLQLSIDANAQTAEGLEDACFAAGAISVTLTDAADAPIFEPDLNTTPLWPNVKVCALFPADADRESILAAISGAGRHTFTEIADRAWEREWLADFKPMSFGARLWIYPHEHAVTAANAVVVRLDPGLAFGTGTHPTTAMCLRWLDGENLEGQAVIDYGCGSGILAIAAVKLGAVRAFAVDHDPQALLATRENSLRNNVEHLVVPLPPHEPLPRVDVLIANILAVPLIELSSHFQTLLQPGGHLVLSGILADQAESVAAAYAPWFEMRPLLREGDWIRLHGVRR